MFRITPRTTRLALALLATITVTVAPAHARPTGNTIPAAQPPQAIAAGTEAVDNFLNDFGDLSLSVAVVEITSNGQIVPGQTPLIRALGAEVESQLRKYTGNLIDILSVEVSPERAQRILNRQNINADPSDIFAREVVELSSAPYLITIEVGPPADRGTASAGPVILRFVEVATGRILNTISSQYYEDRQAFPNINTATWNQHSVTYWMNEMMGWDSRAQACSGGLPAALAGPFKMRLQFTGTIPRSSHEQLKTAIASAAGIDNPKRVRIVASRENGLDVATSDIRVEEPPHFVIDEMVANIQESMAAAGLTAQPLREVGGDVIFAISSTPMWWALTSGDTDNAAYKSWQDMLESNNQPSIAVMKYADPALIKELAGLPQGAALAGSGSVMTASIEAQLRDLGADVIAVESTRIDYSNYPWGSVKDVQMAMPEELRRRAEWAFVVEIVPSIVPGDQPRVLARLVDLQADRVLGSAVFPGNKAAVPPGEQVPDESTHAARYLVGTTAGQTIAGDKGVQILDLVLLDSPSFDFANRVGNIARGQDDAIRAKLPTWQAGQPYSIEVHYRGSPEDFVERLRADLTTLPLEVGAFEEGRITLVHVAP